MMQDYRPIKPHTDADAPCPACTPNGPGHQQCQAVGCEQIGVHQTRRHATAQEYNALPEGLRPIDGVCHKVVFACEDHGEDSALLSFCDHPEPTPVACPTCSAVGDQPCTTKAGTPRWTEHQARAAAQPRPEACRHAHREDCPVFEGCRCTSDDPNPVRAPRLVAPALVDTSATGLPLAQAAAWALQHGIDLTQVASKFECVRTQDTQPAFKFEVYQLDGAGHRVYDEHGRPVTTERIIPVDLPPGLGPTRLLRP